MTRLHKRAWANQIFRMESHSSRSVWFGAYELLYGDARLVEDEPARYAAVTADDIRRVVARYLTPARRARVEVLPAKAEEAKK
jgi:predicted Zn-dependent peptidase